MKKIILILLAVVSLSACTNNGKKVSVEGTKAEVYYKGDGVTESDAKKTGNFLKEQSYFSDEKKASAQITREGGVFTIRFVYNKSVYESLKNADEVFQLLAIKASKEVFGGEKVNIALADRSFKDYKTIPYNEATAKALEAPAKPADDETVLFKEDFGHDSANGIDFYWKGISDEESKTIADYILKNGSFSGGTSAELYMTKDGSRYIIRFPVSETSRTNPAFIDKLGEVTKQIKDNLFANVPFTFAITDEKLKIVKTWDY